MKYARWLIVLVMVVAAGCVVHSIDGGSPERSLSRSEYVHEQIAWCQRQSERAVDPGDARLLWLEAARRWEILGAGGPYE